MKRTIINLGLVLVAFAIGVSIENACSKSIMDMSDSDLRNLVLELQGQVNELKEKVAKLEGGTDGGLGGFNGGFYVGRVPFFPSGSPDVQYASNSTSEVISYNKLTGKNDYHYITKSQTQKDSQGRLLKSTTSYEVLENNLGTDYYEKRISDSESSYTTNTCEHVLVQESTTSKITQKVTYFF